jgi:YbbR domain-containing protein
MAWHPLRNFWLKILAVFLGALLWFTVSGQQAERTVPGVPVVYHNKPPSLELTSRTQFVDIHVRGLDNQLRTIQSRDFEVRVDLTDVAAGEQTITLRTDQVATPLGIEVTQVDPGSATVVLEPSGSASLPVRPHVDGTPAPGFLVSQVSVEPASIDGAKSTVVANVGVGVLDSALRLREPRIARVTVRIEAAGERTIAAARVTVRNVEARRRASAQPAVVSLTLRGAQPVLSQLDPDSIAPYVDVTGLGPGRHEVPVLLDLTGPLSVVAIRPATVTVIIN